MSVEETVEVIRVAAFSMGDKGGNPAGVVVGKTMPLDGEMQRIAAEVGYSETAFAAPVGDDWRVRYFSPETEVPFCGHATIALGSVLAKLHGDGLYDLKLNEAEIVVEGAVHGASAEVALQSPPTRSKAATQATLEAVTDLFGYSAGDIDATIPPAVIHAGNDHFCLTLNTRKALARMDYDLVAGRALMKLHGWVTILLVWREADRIFHVRNAFASGGVLEDPATGAAAAAFGGYLRDIGWPHGGSIEMFQGEDMNCPSRIKVEISPQTGSSIRISGQTREIREV